jgi:hypothetical protein
MVIPAVLFNESTFSLCAHACGKPMQARNNNININKPLNDFTILNAILFA